MSASPREGGVVDPEDARPLWVLKWLAYLLVVAGAALVPVGFMFNRRLWYVAGAMLFVGAVVLIWERTRRGGRSDVDLDIESGALPGVTPRAVRQSRQVHDLLDGDDD